jgi:hypothetical protein
MMMASSPRQRSLLLRLLRLLPLPPLPLQRPKPLRANRVKRKAKKAFLHSKMMMER